MEFSLLDECRRWVSLALDEHGATNATGAHSEMVLRAALGTSLTWARGPVAETSAAWSRALELARQLDDTEIQLQAQYGLWLFSLRTGRYSEALRFATDMMALAAEAKDDDAFATAQRIAGVSKHFLGDHAAGRSLIETALIWHEKNRPRSVFRFGLDQYAAGLAFLARILWVQGFTADAVSAANSAVEHAAALDHACTLCCALAEGTCMISALNRDLPALGQAAEVLTRTASRHGLQFWKAYGDIFDLWATMQAHPGRAASGRLNSVIRTLHDIHFDLRYTPFVADLFDSPASRTSRRIEPMRIFTLPSANREDSHWATPEFLRIEAAVKSEHGDAPPQTTVEQRLEDALALARARSAPSWELRIAIDLARLLVADNCPDKARALLHNTISSFPDGSESEDWRTAETMMNELHRQSSAQG
jgi:hypothetical protein